MHTRSLTYLLCFLVPTRVTVASPIATWLYHPNLSERQLGNCSDLRHNLTASCWDELDISTKLNTWWQTNEAACTAQNASFASCYQQIAGLEQQQCDTTGPNMCDYPDNFSGYTPEQAYILYSIFAIWQWFESIYEAVENADVSATGPVGQIVKAINPEVPQKQPLGNFLQALTATTPLLSLPASLGKAVTSLAETALRQSPGVFKQLNPTGTLDSEFVQVNNLYDGLGIIKTTYQQNVSAALALVQQNFTTFSTFAAHGAFIAPQSSLQADTQTLTLSLETYIIAQCLTANNIVVTLARETNPHELATNGSLTTPNLVSCEYYDQYGVCSDWWYDPGTNAAYSLSSIADPSTNYYDLMERMFSSGWTSGSDLFLGAKACADWVAANGADKGPALDPVTMTARCISNVQVCVWNSNCTTSDGKCEFTGEYGWNGCGTSKRYMEDTCDSSSGAPTIDVPAAYLGAADTDTNPDLVVCNDES